jgi:hypothetical protein
MNQAPIILQEGEVESFLTYFELRINSHSKKIQDRTLLEAQEKFRDEVDSLARSTKELFRVFGSLSWKLTSPFRIVSNIIRLRRSFDVLSLDFTNKELLDEAIAKATNSYWWKITKPFRCAAVFLRSSTTFRK